MLKDDRKEGEREREIESEDEEGGRGTGKTMNTKGNSTQIVTKKEPILSKQLLFSLVTIVSL